MKVQGVDRQRREREMPALARPNEADVALVDVDHQPVMVGGRDRQQRVAALHRRAERLAEIALDDDAVDRRNEPAAIELGLHQVELGARFGRLGLEDDELRAVGACERRAIGVFVLRQLAFPLALFEPQVLVGELDEHVAGLDRIAGADVRGAQETVARRGDDALHRAFEPRRCADAIRQRHQRQRHDSERHAAGDQLRPRMARLAKALPRRTHRLRESFARRQLGALAQREQRTDEHPQALVLRQLALARRLAGALESERAVALAGDDHRHGADAAAGAHRHIGVRQNHARRVFGRSRVDDAGTLVDRLVHRRREVAQKVLPAFDAAVVRESDHLDLRAGRNAEADAVEAEGGRQFVDELGRRFGQPGRAEQQRLQAQQARRIDGLRRARCRAGYNAAPAQRGDEAGQRLLEITQQGGGIGVVGDAHRQRERAERAACVLDRHGDQPRVLGVVQRHGRRHHGRLIALQRDLGGGDQRDAQRPGRRPFGHRFTGSQPHQRAGRLGAPVALDLQPMLRGGRAHRMVSGRGLAKCIGYA